MTVVSADEQSFLLRIEAEPLERLRISLLDLHGTQVLAEGYVPLSGVLELSRPWPEQAQRYHLSTQACPLAVERYVVRSGHSGPAVAPVLSSSGRSVRIAAASESSSSVVLFRRDVRSRDESAEVLCERWEVERDYVDFAAQLPSLLAYSIANSELLELDGRVIGQRVGARGPESYAIFVDPFDSDAQTGEPSALSADEPASDARVSVPSLEYER